MEDFNVIEDDETYIGKVKDIRKLFLNQIKTEIENKNTEETEKVDNIKMIIELLEDLQEEENEDLVIRVIYNYMGCFNYKEIE